MDEAPAYDERLWITRAGVDGRGYLLGNPHTYRGRMAVWFPAIDDQLYVSKCEVVDASPEAGAWIAGYLSGSEMDAHELFGPEMANAEDDDERWERWRGLLREYRETGDWLYYRWREPSPFPEGTPLPPYVWTLCGPDVWVWADGAWQHADPQPPLDGRLLAGSLCDRRDRCSMAVVTPDHTICEDCGRVTT